MLNKWCGFGKCSLSYLYILLTALMFLLKSSLLNLGDLSFNTGNNIFGFETVIKNHGLMKLLLEYLGYIAFGAIFLKIFEKKETFKKEIEVIRKNSLIYQKQRFNIRTFILMLIACGAFALQLIIRSILNYCSVWMLDFWVFNMIFIPYLMKKTFKITIYKHKMYSLIFNFSINFIILIIASSLKTNDGVSDYDSIKNLYGSYLYIVLFYIIYLILSAILSFSQVLQKQLMDLEYVSAFKLLFVIGLISSFFGLLTIIITSNVECRGLMAENNLCPISHPDYDNGKAHYFDNALIFFSNLGDQFDKDKLSFFLEIFIVYPLYSFICFAKYFCETMVVYLLDPNHVLISDTIYYGTRKFVTLIYFPNDTKNYLKLLGEIIALFGYMFYLEIFEINCCGFNFDTRTSINRRSRLESKANNDIEEDDDDEEDDLFDKDNKKEYLTYPKKKENEMVEIRGNDEDNNKENNTNN